MPPKPSDLEPGDCLLYSPHDLFGYITCLKTWSPTCHCEVFAGLRESLASRNGIGVNRYSLRMKGLAAVLRPKGTLDWFAGLKWFESVRGQKYDWLGLFCFTLAVKQGAADKMFCSEFAKRLYHACKCDVIHENWDADKTAPGSYLQSIAFDWVWTKWGAGRQDA